MLTLQAGVRISSAATFRRLSTKASFLFFALLYTVIVVVKPYDYSNKPSTFRLDPSGGLAFFYFKNSTCTCTGTLLHVVNYICSVIQKGIIMIPHIQVDTLQQAFDLYYRGTSEPDASDSEQDAARKDFYAGAASVVTLLTQALKEGHHEGFAEVFHQLQEDVMKHITTNLMSNINYNS